MKKNNIKNSEEWFRIGDDELSFAEKNLKDGDKFYAQICFYFQQAVEKYLKGYLVLNGIKPPKIHDLEALIKLASGADEDLVDFVEGGRILNKFYISSRYPGSFQIYNKKDAMGAYKITKEIIEHIRKGLKVK